MPRFSDMTTMHVPDWSLGDRLRRVRRDAHLSQSAMADRLGVGRGAYSQWESDLGRPRELVEVARKIEEEFEVPAAWVLGVDGLATRQKSAHLLTRSLRPLALAA